MEYVVEAFVVSFFKINDVPLLLRVGIKRTVCAVPISFKTITIDKRFLIGFVFKWKRGNQAPLQIITKNNLCYDPVTTVNPAATKVAPKKFAGTGSCPVKTNVYPDKSPIAAPVTIVPPDTSIPCFKPA